MGENSNGVLGICMVRLELGCPEICYITTQFREDTQSFKPQWGA
jgi:hypothetical protein